MKMDSFSAALTIVIYTINMVYVWTQKTICSWLRVTPLFCKEDPILNVKKYYLYKTVCICACFCASSRACNFIVFGVLKKQERNAVIHVTDL